MINNKKNKILITGSAGFVGFHTTIKLLNLGHDVVGVDNLNRYYDQSLKKDRLKEIFKISKKAKGKFIFFKCDINDKKKILNIFKKNKFHQVIHLAAQVGVRNSIKYPFDYFSTNLFGFCNILENCKNYSVKHLIFASSSSVYGSTNKFPFSEHSSSSDQPIQLYAATKRSNEIIAYSYSHLYKMKITALRFFTVYGPYGRPDMALFKFVKSALKNKKIDLYNFGNHIRDFTYIDDVVKIIYLSINKIPKLDKNKSITEFQSKAPWRIYNISSSRPVKLKKFVRQIEKQLNTKINFKNLPLQVGDVKIATGSMRRTISKFGYKPKYQTNYGIKKFVSWYKEYYKLT